MASLFLGTLVMTYEKEKQRVSKKPRDMEPNVQQTTREHKEGNEAAEVHVCHFKTHNIRRTSQSLGVLGLLTYHHISV